MVLSSFLHSQSHGALRRWTKPVDRSRGKFSDAVTSVKVQKFARDESAQRPSGCTAHCAALPVEGRNFAKMQQRTCARSDLWGILRPCGLWASMRCPVWTGTRLTGGLHRRSGVILDCSAAKFTRDGLSSWQEKFSQNVCPRPLGKFHADSK